ncbi:MAG: DegV family protein [Chloroflexi bacterium]|nr:DegV family protein [Chloroflexota bacterium]
MRKKVALACDSAVCLPPELVEELRLHVVPLELSIDGRTYLDGVDISPVEFYSRLPRLGSLPTTSAPSPASFITAFSEAASHGDSVLCLTLLSAVSATYNVAVAAAEMAQDAFPDAHIEVMDTGTAAGGEGLVVLAAARAASGGADLTEVKAEAQRVMQRVNLVAFLDTLQYLWKGGRVPRIAAWAGSILRVKPLLELGQGEIRPLERPRTRRRAMERLVALVRERAGEGPIRANVMHAVALDDALALKEGLLRQLDCVEVLVSEFTPVMGTHTGPGLLGIAFYREDAG